ncbi:MAG: hypothetical protein ACRDXC_11855 [Acidimicrobiales bacterium]
MRKVIVLGALALALGAIAWGVWPSSSWPAAFCKPVIRVVGRDADAVAHYQMGQPTGGAVTPTERALFKPLIDDARLAESHAPTPQLERELRRYATMLTAARTPHEVGVAIRYFYTTALPHLSGCGVKDLATTREAPLTPTDRSESG